MKLEPLIPADNTIDFIQMKLTYKSIRKNTDFTSGLIEIRTEPLWTKTDIPEVANLEVLCFFLNLCIYLV